MKSESAWLKIMLLETEPYLLLLCLVFQCCCRFGKLFWWCNRLLPWYPYYLHYRGITRKKHPCNCCCCNIVILPLPYSKALTEKGAGSSILPFWTSELYYTLCSVLAILSFSSILVAQLCLHSLYIFEHRCILYFMLLLTTAHIPFPSQLCIQVLKELFTMLYWTEE